MVEQVTKHDAHVMTWANSFFKFPRQPIEIRGPLVFKKRREDGTVEAEGFVKIPAMWEGHPIHPLPNEIVEFFTGFWDSPYNNPHYVTAAQVGTYTDMNNKAPEFDPNVIDVEARVVETPKELPAPKGEEDE